MPNIVLKKEKKKSQSWTSDGDFKQHYKHKSIFLGLVHQQLPTIRKNIRSKVKKSSKTGLDQKTFISAFA